VKISAGSIHRFFDLMIAMILHFPLLGGVQGWVNLPDEGDRGKYKAVR